jgi:transposase InsO family protein
MNKSTKLIITSKWKRILEEYEKVKNKSSNLFTQVKEICEAYNVSRKDIQKYYNRWIQSRKNIESLIPRKRGPRAGTTKLLSKKEERIIIKIKRKLETNEHELFHLLKGKFNIHPSVSTIYRTFKRYPLNKKQKKKILRYEKKYPGEMGHSDLHQISKSFMKDKKRRYVFGLIDDCTRLCFVKVIPDSKAKTVTKAFYEGCKWFDAHGIHFDSLMTDNGTEFTTPINKKYRENHTFEIMLNIFNIKHVYTKVYRPQTNGKIERFWRTLEDKCLSLLNPNLTDTELTLNLKAFMYHYNYQRIHSGLKYITPLDKLIFVTETLK